MLGKLIKNEFKDTARFFIPIYIAAFAASLLAFISFKINLKKLSVLSAVLIGIIAISCVVVTFVAIITRFSNNMTRDEGYLTHTLPVSNFKLILSKEITNICWIVLSILLAVSLLLIFTSSLDNISDFLKYLFNNDMFRKWNLVPMIVIAVLIALFSILCQMNLIYMSISIGQLPPFASHRTLFSLLSYFVVSFAVGSVVGLISSLMVKLSLFSNLNNSPIFYSMSPECYADQMASPVSRGTLIAMLLILAYYIVMTVVYFSVTNFIMKKHLNLA